MSRWDAITPAGENALRAMREHGGPMSHTALAKAIGRTASSTGEIVARLIASGHVQEVPRPQTSRNYAPLIQAAPVVPVSPAAPPPSKPRVRQAPPRAVAAAAVQPTLPAAFAAYRGVRHPIPPKPYDPAPGESKARWLFLTTIKAARYE